MSRAARRAKYDTTTSSMMSTDGLATPASDRLSSGPESRRRLPGQVTDPRQPVIERGGSGGTAQVVQPPADQAINAITIGAPPKDAEEQASMNWRANGDRTDQGQRQQ